jgi:argininosuccinate lyase
MTATSDGVASRPRYPGFRQPGGRLREPVVPELAAHRPDRGVALLPAIHDFDRAHLVGLVEAGWIDPAGAAQLLDQLEAAAARGVEASRQEAGGGIHSGEYLLVAALGEDAGGRISLGRSSADLGAVALRTVERDRLLDLGEGLVGLRRAVGTAAAAHLDVVLPTFAQGQPAQPTTVAHYLAAWGEALARDTDRVLVAYRRVNRSPAGAAIGTGSPFAADRERVAALLGFDEPIASTLDAVTGHDHVLDVLSALAVLGNDLARLADDLMAWSAPGYGFVRFPDRFCGTSSILAHARNPYATQYVKGVAAAAAGALVHGLTVDRAGTGEAVLDRHQLSESLLGLFGQTIRNVRWLAELVPALEWQPAPMAEAARRHWTTAPDLAGLLVQRAGLSWRSAHQVTAIAVRRAEEGGLGPSDVTPALVDEAARLHAAQLAAGPVPYPVPLTTRLGLSPAEIAGALDAAASVAARTLLGGPAPDAVRGHLRELARLVEVDAGVLAGHRVRLAAARSALDAAVAALRSPAVSPR